MSNPEEGPVGGPSAYLLAALAAAEAVESDVDPKVELRKLLDEWEEQQHSSTEQLVSILTK